MNTYGGSEYIDPRILDLDTSWRRVVSFKTRPLYFRGKSPLDPWDRRPGRPQNRSGRHGEEINLAQNLLKIHMIRSQIINKQTW
jgi:hypothetical protein